MTKTRVLNKKEVNKEEREVLKNAPIHIVIDTREQLPLLFERYDCETTRGTLTSGDYSPEGHESACAVERKSLDDLIGCLTIGRDRFERELSRLAEYQVASVVIEASMDDVRLHRYTSRAKPHAMLQSVIALSGRYRLPFVWAGNRAGGEYVTFWTLEKYLREATLIQK